MRPPLTAGFILSTLLGCAPSMVVPAVGTRLPVTLCYSTSQNVHVYRYGTARCPRQDGVEERIRRVEERYSVKLAGARVFMVDAYVTCGDVSAYGCTSGSDLTVTTGYAQLGVMQHELTHLAIDRAGLGSLAHSNLDEPTPGTRRRD